VKVHSIRNAQDGWPVLFSLTAEELAKRIRAALADRESIVDIDSISGRIAGSS
jgi:hypothetical protein